MKQRKSIDKIFFIIVTTLLLVGFLIFISAALGTLEDSKSKFWRILLSQLGFGLIGGTCVMILTARVKHQFIRKHAFWFLIISIILSLMVFVPGIGMEHGGAKRWIDLGITTFQPGELLKLSVIIYLGAWLTLFKRKIHSPFFGIYPLLIVLGIACAIFIAQRDTGLNYVISF